MNKYTKLSDFEINKKVAEKLGLLPYLFIANDVGELIWDVPSNDNYYGFISKRGCGLDFCHDPSNTMPIIIESGISMVRVNNTWSARQFNNHCIEINGDNYYRIAMICFLLMKDAENENNNDS